MDNTLVTKDSKGKIRVIHIWAERTETDEGDFYVIHRTSGLKGGKIINQPDVEIYQGKAKRTVFEQATLQFNSEVKKYLDKGYKSLKSLGINTLAELDEEKFLKESVTNQNGVQKPMLCKVFDFSDTKNKDKTWYISRKFDGVRCFLYYKDNEIRTASRGGQDYDIPATHIRNDAFLKRLFESNPNLILDGEIYRHGWPLSKISGLCRLDNVTDDHKELKFYCYDIVDETKSFDERWSELTKIQTDLIENLYWNGEASKLFVVQHYKIECDSESSLKETIMKYHDQFIQEGYEGAVVRDSAEKYKCGARDRRMQKIKLFTDDEYKILGIVEGLRDEDMCFLMETVEGYEFKAKPVGTRAEKQYYREHINEMIGKMATVKHFGMTTTEHPVPNLPVWKCLRDKKDM